MKRVLLTLTLATVAGALVFGAAASLNVGSANLGSGSAAVAACDTTDSGGVAGAIDVAYNLAASDPRFIESVTVSDIDSACSNQTVHVMLFDSAGGELVQGSATADTSGTLTIPMATSAEAIEEAHVVING